MRLHSSSWMDLRVRWFYFQMNRPDLDILDHQSFLWCIQEAGQTGGPASFIQSHPIMTCRLRDERGEENQREGFSFRAERPPSTADSFLFQRTELSPTASSRNPPSFSNILHRRVTSERGEVMRGRGPASWSTAAPRGERGGTGRLIFIKMDPRALVLLAGH